MAQVLVAYYSRSGHTARLAQVLVDEMRRCGNEVAAEAIRAEREWSRWLLPVPLLPLLPLLPVYLLKEATAVMNEKIKSTGFFLDMDAIEIFSLLSSRHPGQACPASPFCPGPFY